MHTNTSKLLLFRLPGIIAAAETLCTGSGVCFATQVLGALAPSKEGSVLSFCAQKMQNVF